MGLSSDLISQFAKVTTSPKEKKSTESTLFGTAIEYNGKMYVRLDGSDLLTPVNTTTVVEDGERVTVLLKNHNATVTGNLSSPAVRKETVDNLDGEVKEIGNQISEFEIVIADKVSTSELDAQKARIDSLVAEDVTIKGLISANQALIDELEAENATITGKLEANEAEIESLQTTKLDVSVATATYATIDNLEATNANIHNLEADYGDFVDLTTEKLTALEGNFNSLDTIYATIDQLAAEQARIDILETNSLTADSAVIKTLQSDVADIDTLIFGSASGSTIQTSFANAVIAQLGNAQIKSAMIESLSASKITSGDIITNNVRVLSEDGKLLISDETIQISDDTRVRVQIGKDAADDYSINIWDADGNLMFSEGGITDSAIKEAIIRNDMVSDTANISAHKLDISSLFEEINDSTYTIKSSKIYLSDQEQTLDVAFTTMVSDLDDLEGTVTSQGTQLSVVQGQISSKIWQEDIDAASETLNTKYTTLEQDLDSLSATVASHTTTIANKADSSTVTAVSDKVSELELSLDGFKSTVSSTYATKTEVESIDSDLTALTTRVTTAESEIDQNAEAIALRVTKTEMSDTLAGYSTTSEMNAAIELKADEINSTVASTYATQTEVSEIETRVSTAETSITQNTEQIALRATKTELTTVQTQAANAQTAADEAQDSADAAQTTANNALSSADDAMVAANAAQGDIDNLEIGGRNLLPNSNFELTYTSYAGLGTGIYPLYYTCYNGGVDDAENVYPAYIDNTTFDYNVLAFNESNGYRNWKAILISSNIDSLLLDMTSGDDNTYTLSMDAYQTISGGQVFGGFYYQNSADSSASFYSGKFTITTSVIPVGEWGRVSVIIPYNNDLVVGGTCALYIYGYSFSSDAIVYVKNLKLEKGNRATDWTPAPEDVDTKIDDTANDIHQTISNQYTELVSTCEAMILKAAENYADITEYESFKSEISAQLQLMADQMSLQFSETTSHIETVNGELQNQINTITKYFTFDVDGLTVGQVDSPNHVIIDHETVTIMSNGNVVQEFDAEGNALTPKLRVTRGFELFGYSVDHDAKGNLNCELIDDYYLQTGRNLVLNSDTAVTSANYCVKSRYEVSDYLDSSKKYTVSMSVTPATGVTYYCLYLSSGHSGPSATIYTDGTTNTQVITKTFTPFYASGKTPEVSASYGKPYIYRFPNDGTVTESSTIHWIKIEPGEVATDWTPAPEDE